MLIKPMFIKLTFVFLLIVSSPFAISGYSYEYLSDGNETFIYILVVDPQEDAIIPVRASGEEITRETVLTLAKRYGAVAAVNGGFWNLDGTPAGILKISDQWYGTPLKPRGAIGWTLNGQHVLIDRVLTNYSLQECEDLSQIEVIPVSDFPHTNSEEWKEVNHIVGGTPVLVSYGTLIEDYAPEQTRESFLIKKHPRTAVGIRENGEWIFVVVDGRFEGELGGMTMKELAKLMCELGCIEALNLDGGSSSTLVIEGTVVNQPCGEIQEEGKLVTAVSDAILIFPLTACPDIK